MAKSAAVERLPSSWGISTWPTGVWPGDSARGRYVVRANKDELVAAGALVRVGRDLVIVGQNYASWLSKQSGRVHDFAIAPNKRQSAA